MQFINCPHTFAVPLTHTSSVLPYPRLRGRYPSCLLPASIRRPLPRWVSMNGIVPPSTIRLPARHKRYRDPAAHRHCRPNVDLITCPRPACERHLQLNVRLLPNSSVLHSTRSVVLHLFTFLGFIFYFLLFFYSMSAKRSCSKNFN